ncbi:MAG: hypothetical protein ABI651_13775 [Verrucomicrobiota bacterium]
MHRDNQRAMKGWLAATVLLGAVFIVGQGLEYWHLFRSGLVVNSIWLRDHPLDTTTSPNSPCVLTT